MATRKTVLSNFHKKSEEIVGRIKYALNLYKIDASYTINDFYSYGKLEHHQLFAVIMFIEENYKLSEEERKDVMKYYWEVDDIIKRVVKEAEAEGWRYNSRGSWNIFEKTV